MTVRCSLEALECAGRSQSDTSLEATTPEAIRRSLDELDRTLRRLEDAITQARPAIVEQEA